MSWPWPTARLGDVCQTGAGGTPLSSRKEYYEGGAIPWLVSGEVAQGEITASSHFITELGLENSSAKVFPENTVLVAMYGATAGQVGILRFKAATNQAVCGILPNDKFLPKFTYYLLLSKKQELVSKAAGNAQPNISQIKIKNTTVPLPSLPEQQRIVAILDEAFAGLATATANAEKNLNNAGELFDSYLRVVFSDEKWIRKKLEEVCTLQRGFDLPKRQRKNGTVPLVSSSGIIDTHVEAKVRGPGVVTGRSGSIGNVFFIHQGFWPLNTTLYVKDFCGNDQEFIYYLLKQFDLGEHATGMGVPTLNRNFISDVIVSVPGSLTEQKKVVGSLKSFETDVERAIDIYERKLRQLAELKQAILQKACSGELTSPPSQAIREAAE